ncbi:MAG: hypothetical protein JWM47_4567 [Acidimicrobiales bacterium]|nr:hypothetical protein [Acidimicrobiales bacterium]
MRDPGAVELVLWVCELQPELDEEAAVRIIRRDEDLERNLIDLWQRTRSTAACLLELHLELEGSTA